MLLNDHRLATTLMEYELEPTLTNRDNLTAVDLASFIPDGQISREMKSRPAFLQMFSNRY